MMINKKIKEIKRNIMFAIEKIKNISENIEEKNRIRILRRCDEIKMYLDSLKYRYHDDVNEYNFNENQNKLINLRYDNEIDKLSIDLKHILELPLEGIKTTSNHIDDNNGNKILEICSEIEQIINRG